MSKKTIYWLTDGEQKRLKDFSADGCENFHCEEEHWIYGRDKGESYCYGCAKKRVDELLKENPEGEFEVDGGWSREGDSVPFCDECGVRLWNDFTFEACEMELEHFDADGFDVNSEEDCDSLFRMISACGWGNKKDREGSRKGYYSRMHKLGRKILAELDKKSQSQPEGEL